MRHRRLYIIPEYYRDEEGVIPNAFVCTMDDSEEVRVLTTSEEDLKALTDEMNACQTVVPSAESFLEVILSINLDLDLEEDFGYTIEGVFERGRNFGYTGPMRDTALLMGIKYPGSIWLEASFFREPGSLGRHLPEEDEELFRKVIDQDKEVLRAMREIDRRIVREEEEFYRVFEKGRLGSTSERGFIWQKAQAMQENLFLIRSQEPPLPDDVRIRISVPYVPVPAESWQRRYYSALCSASIAASEWKDWAVRLGDKLPICFSRKGNRIEVYPDGCFPIFYHMAKPSADGFTAMRGETPGEPMFNTDITLTDAIADLVTELQYAKHRELMSIPGIGTGVTKIIKRTRSSVELSVMKDCAVVTKAILDEYNYKYEIVTE